jgi:hypothetical protein
MYINCHPKLSMALIPVNVYVESDFWHDINTSSHEKAYYDAVYSAYIMETGESNKCHYDFESEEKYHYSKSYTTIAYKLSRNILTHPLMGTLHHAHFDFAINDVYTKHVANKTSEQDVYNGYFNRAISNLVLATIVLLKTQGC